MREAITKSRNKERKETKKIGETKRVDNICN